MSRDWKPGDVAMVDYKGSDGEQRATWATECGTKGHTTSAHWHIADRHTYLPGIDGIAARPLLILDPDSAEQMEALLAQFVLAVDASDVPAHPQGWAAPAFAAAVRALLNPKPPRPDEPTGIGALVLDSHGDYLCRNADGRWLILDGGSSYISDWADVETPTILSVGVSDEVTA